MHERVAREVMLMRSIELADQDRQILSDADRNYASRSAKELAQWQAAEQKSGSEPEYFLQHRAEQTLKRIGERYPSLSPFISKRSSTPVLMLLLPALSLLAGVGMDRIGNPHRVDLLSAPLLLIIGWNLLVYIGMIVYLFMPSGPAQAGAGGLVRKFSAGRNTLPRKLPSPLTTALMTFSAEWGQVSSRLNAARFRRTMHLSAALFAAGAILSLYARGMLNEYAAGWESTFLDAAQVHSILSILFAPAVAVFPIQGFSVAEIEALRFGQQVSPGGGERWVHLYAATLLLLVVLPRLLLAAVAQWQAGRLEKNFPIDLQQPYFRKLTASIGGSPGILRVLPYSFTLDEARDKGLHQIAHMLLGEQARVMLRPSSSYGNEPQDALKHALQSEDGATLTAVLFNLAATPEKENQGAFLDFVRHASVQRIAVLIDESAYLERIGTQAGGKERLAERIALWEEFCNYHKAPATIVNLLNPSAHPIDSDTDVKVSAEP